MVLLRVGFSLVGVIALGAALLAGPAASAQQGPSQPPQIEAGVAPGAPVPDTRPGEAFADPKIAQLQHTASDVQRQLADLSTQIHAAEADLDKADDSLAAARAERSQADAVVAAQQDEVDDYSAALFSALGPTSDLQVLLNAAHPDDFLAGAALVEHLRADQDRRLTDALAHQQAAVDAENVAARAQQGAADRRVELDRRNQDAADRAAAVSSELRGTLADADAAVVAQQTAQRERNTRTAANWQAYLDKLAAAGIVSPPATTLRDPARLPAGLAPLTGSSGTPQPGGAQVSLPSGERLLVLPAETVTAVGAAIGALGKPYVPDRDGEGPAAYSCDGLVHAVYSGAGLALPPAAGDQLATLTPVAAADVEPGDLVFLGPARYGVQGVGIVLDGRTMLTADARLVGVVVADIPSTDTVLGYARPSLAPRPAQPVPARTDTGLVWRCGGVQLPPRAVGEATGGWGGYPNGMIPQAALCPLGVGSHRLRCDAAQAYLALSAAYGSAFGQPLCITDSYRTFEQQVVLYGVKPALAAIPGTSNHGWGLAVDLCGGVQSFGTGQYAWMRAHAGALGWSNPPWAQPGNGREEPWHWEYVG